MPDRLVIPTQRSGKANPVEAMLTKKTRALFVEVNGFSYNIAAVSGLAPPFSVESLHEFPKNEPEKLKAFLEQNSSARRTRFLNAHCGFVPESRFVRLHTIESMTRAKDGAYFSNLLEQQFRIDPNKVLYAAVNAQSGEDFNPDKSLASQKELMLCGADKDEITSVQDTLVDAGVIPQSLQIGTLSSIAGLKHYLQVKGAENPVMMLEISQSVSNLFIVSKEKVELCRPINFGFNGVLPIIQNELGLKDEASARSLFYSNTFDFREVGPKLLNKLLKELNSSTGFFEVQTGQTIPYMYMTALPENLAWIPDLIAREMDISMLDISWETWSDNLGITYGDDCSSAHFGPSNFGLFSLFVNFENLKNGTGEEK